MIIFGLMEKYTRIKFRGCLLSYIEHRWTSGFPVLVGVIVEGIRVQYKIVTPLL